LQDLIIGNPVFADKNIASYRTNGNNELSILMIGDLFKHLITLDNSNFRIIHSKLDDVDVVRNRTCDISFSDYQTTTGFAFSTKRRISVAEKSKLDINLDFKNYEFNQPVTFPFTVPKNYKIAK
jgi:outer membrane lipoprotein-sorting protein